MLKIGDKVRIKSDLKSADIRNGVIVARDMSAFAGSEGYIRKVRENGTYEVNTCWPWYPWTDDMLELIESAPEEDKTNDPRTSSKLVMMTPEEHKAAHRKDMVNHPPHYTKRGIETIELIKNGVEDFPSYCAGNIIKYVSRYPHKNGVEDLKKAKWYLERLIEEESKNG